MDGSSRDPAFGLTKPGTAMRTRFTNLISQYRADQCQSMPKFGTVEEYEEREVLLQNIMTLMDDWKESEEMKKNEKSAKQRGIESSGALLRRLAMGELAEDESDESESLDSSDQLDERSNTVSQAASIPVATRMSATDAQPGSAAVAAIEASTTTPNKRPRSVSQSRYSGSKNKITKREQLGEVTTALTGAILGAGEEAKAKYEYKTKRLEFEREQEEQKRRHEKIEAEKRREHELRIEERREKAEEEREKRMHDLLLKFLGQQTPN